jgi:hypothetical protein
LLNQDVALVRPVTLVAAFLGAAAAQLPGEAPELIADRIITFAKVVAEKTSSPAPTVASTVASIPNRLGHAARSDATAQRSPARSCGVEFKSAYAAEENKKQDSEK